MGDAARFRTFARLISERFPDRKIRIADVAGGRGGLLAELRQLGYTDVTSWDKRKRNAKGRSCYRYGLFDWQTEERFELVVGMHPDGATDHIIRYGYLWRRPFMVCPCCVIPGVYPYSGPRDYWAWMGHLLELTEDRAKSVELVQLPITGRSHVIVGIFA